MRLALEMSPSKHPLKNGLLNLAVWESSGVLNTTGTSCVLPGGPLIPLSIVLHFCAWYCIKPFGLLECPGCVPDRGHGTQFWIFILGRWAWIVIHKGKLENRNAVASGPHTAGGLVRCIMRSEGHWRWACLCARSVTSLVSNSLWHYGLEPPGSSVHGILQARILEWVAIPFSRGSSQPEDWTCVCLCLLPCWWILYPLSHQGSP